MKKIQFHVACSSVNEPILFVGSWAIWVKFYTELTKSRFNYTESTLTHCSLSFGQVYGFESVNIRERTGT